MAGAVARLLQGGEIGLDDSPCELCWDELPFHPHAWQGSGKAGELTQDAPVGVMCRRILRDEHRFAICGDPREEPWETLDPEEVEEAEDGKSTTFLGVGCLPLGNGDDGVKWLIGCVSSDCPPNCKKLTG